MIRARVLLPAMVLAGWAAVVFAHTRLASSVPADGAEVEAPSELVLEFSEPVHVTAVTLRTAAGGQALGEIPKGPAAVFVIPVLERLAPGDYSVSWRAVGADTHIVSGELGFVVATR